MANDQKLSHRENGLMTLVAAVLGLSLFKLELLAVPDRSFLMWAVRGLVGTSLVLLLAALAKTLLSSNVAQHSKVTAEGLSSTPELCSGYLRWAQKPGPHRASWYDPRAALLESFEVTERAATALYEKNLERSQAVDSGQIYLLWSAIVAGLAFPCYLWSLAR